MNLLTKIEDLINTLLIRLQELFWALVQRLTPSKVKTFWEKVQTKKQNLALVLKSLPSKIKPWVTQKIAEFKNLLKTFDVKTKIIDSYKAALARTKTSDAEVKGKLSSIKKILAAPILVVGQWLQGLTIVQSLMLLGFTAASILSAISISFEGQRLVKHMDASRAPASAEVEEEYARPGYYKKQTRHVEFSSIRLPVYVPEVNELRTVDVDFIATLSTRQAKMWLEKQEFQLRDHLILNMEPLTASFPLEDEGKEIIRQKFLAEVNQYLIDHKVDAHVTELKLTYVLAN